MKSFIFAMFVAAVLLVGFDLASLAFETFPRTITRYAWVVVLDVIAGLVTAICAAVLLWAHRDE